MGHIFRVWPFVPKLSATPWHHFQKAPAEDCALGIMRGGGTAGCGGRRKPVPSLNTAEGYLDLGKTLFS